MTLTENVEEGAANADIIYTDIWVSMGEPDEVWETRIKLLKDYQVNKRVMSMAKETAIFMHCLPSFHDFETKMAKEQMERGYDIREVTDEVFRSSYSKVFDEAENRMHTIKSVVVATVA